MSDSNDIKDLFDAILRNDEAAVKRLIEKEGVPVTCLDLLDQTVAHVSARSGNLNILKYVVDREPSILTLLDFHGESVIFRAIEGGHLEIVKYLVETRGVDICEPHRHCFGNSAIHKAAEEGNIAILKYFLEEKNGNVNIRNSVQQTPVFVAAESKRSDATKYLIEERNADLTGTDYRGCNILYTTINCDDLKLLKYILDERKVQFDIDWKDESDLTLVHRAAILNRFEILRYLVSEKHADVNIGDKWGKTPLHSAARWNYYDVCKYLIENGANMGAKDDQDQLPINEASEKDLIDYMEKAASQKRRRQRRSATSVSSSEIVSVAFSPRAFPLLEKSFALPRISSDGRARARARAHSEECGANPLCTPHSINFPPVQNFLVLAQTILGRRFKYQQSATFSSVRTSARSPAGDSFVENAVRTMPHFSKSSENE